MFPPAPQVRELRDPSPVVRQKSLLAARELLAAPVNHVQCVAAGATPAIVELLQVGAGGGGRGRALGWGMEGERGGCACGGHTGHVDLLQVGWGTRKTRGTGAVGWGEGGETAGRC